MDVSPEQAVNFFYAVEVNLNETTMVGYMAASAKVHAVEAKPKWKPKDKTQTSAGTGSAEAASAPKSPMKTEGPAPPKPAAQATPPCPDNPVKSKGSGKTARGSERPSVDEKGQQRIRLFRGMYTGGAQCDYGHNPMTSMPRLGGRQRKGSVLHSDADAECN